VRTSNLTMWIAFLPRNQTFHGHKLKLQEDSLFVFIN
jgi:hypothetical protein